MIRVGCTLLAAILLSGGCAGIPPAALAPSAADALWAARQDQLNNLLQWDLRGRVAIRTSESGASAHLRWERKISRVGLIFLVLSAVAKPVCGLTKTVPGCVTTGPGI